MSTPPHSPTAPQRNYVTASHEATMSPAPITFLTLPIDIRFLIYDLFTLTTTHHTITAKTPLNRPPRSLSLVVHRLPGVSLLLVCRKIYAEAMSIRRKVDMVNGMGQQLLVHFNGFGGTGMKGLIKCVAKDDKPNREMDMILQAKLPDEEQYYLPYDCYKLDSGTILRCDFKSYEDIQGLLRRGNKVRRVTIAMDCANQRFYWGRYYSWVWEFYMWVKARGSLGGEKEMEIVLRWFQFDEALQGKVEPGFSPLVDDEFPEKVWEGRTWGCTVGERIEIREFEKWWTNGEKD